MEPVTQALLGAATAELVAGRQLGGRALGWGAAIGMSPDLDVVLGPLHGGFGEWIYHRGTTHSLWFGFVAGPILGWILWRWRDLGRPQLLRPWIALAVVALVTHPLLDGFTPYGTQFFAPFVRDRFAWNGVAIVDPVYSIVLGAGVAVAARRALPAPLRRRRLALALGLSSLYLLAGLWVNRSVEKDLRRALQEETTTIERIRAYPTIFQPWLRSFVVRTPDRLFVGLHSWQEWGCPSWRVHPQPEPTPALDTLRASWQGRVIEWFADGDVGVFESAAPGRRTIRIEDLRYSWATPDARGMWGIEASFDADDRLIGEIVRLGRPPVEREDLTRLGPVLLGRLPAAEQGWQRPPHCGSDQP